MSELCIVINSVVMKYTAVGATPFRIFALYVQSCPLLLHFCIINNLMCGAGQTSCTAAILNFSLSTTSNQYLPVYVLKQVRLLLDRAHTVSKIWNDAPVVLCGDFNCTPKVSILSTF